LQVRLIVWRAKDVVAKDGVDQPTNQEVKEGADPTPKSSSWFSCCGCCCGGSSGSSDVYVTGQFEGMDDKKETDVNTHLFNVATTFANTDVPLQVHWGSADGTANFNWRMKCVAMFFIPFPDFIVQSFVFVFD
jgi:hypothetical protein